MVMGKAAAALAAGCCCVLKPSDLKLISAIKLQKLAIEAGVESFCVVPSTNPAGFVDDMID